MWIVAKVKNNEAKIFQKEIEKKIEKIEFYKPSILFERYQQNKVKKIIRPLLQNYIFCFHEKFFDKNNLNNLKSTKGLEIFLTGYYSEQKEIVKFINFCRKFENSNGFLKPTFFKSYVSKKAKFISGPFTNFLFELIEKQKNKIKIIIGNKTTIVPDNKNYLYLPA